MESYFGPLRYHDCLPLFTEPRPQGVDLPSAYSLRIRTEVKVELDSDIALIAGLIGEPARAAILAALVRGALPAGELAFIGNIAPQTASFHLRKLMEASLITVEKRGKHSYYRLANDSVAAALESLAALAPERDHVAPDRHKSERVKQLRFARSCYKHLAGLLGVQILQALLNRGAIAPDSDKSYRLTEPGETWWLEFGMPHPRDISSRACVDWTERRHHLGGALGAALFSRLKDLRWVIPNPTGRSVRVTHLGARELERQLGIILSR
jgi:DNA-binding transcriptional ArsR family regulator